MSCLLALAFTDGRVAAAGSGGGAGGIGMSCLLALAFTDGGAFFVELFFLHFFRVWGLVLYFTRKYSIVFLF